MALLAIMGPGLIVMVGDNDAGGVATYSQAGQNYGTSLLWVLLLLIPVLIVNQEMVVRLGAVTGVGHARLINERFGRFWGVVLGRRPVPPQLPDDRDRVHRREPRARLPRASAAYVSVPIAAAALIAITSTGSFRSWERFDVRVRVRQLPRGPAVRSWPTRTCGDIARHIVIPGIHGGANSTSVLLIIAIVGTTVAPWQLFFQQSNIIDKRITPRWINYERADTLIGAFVVVIGAARDHRRGRVRLRRDAVLRPLHRRGWRRDRARARARADGRHVLRDRAAQRVADRRRRASRSPPRYAFGDVFGMKHSLHRGSADAKLFYARFALMVGAAAIVLIPGAPLGVITTRGAGARGGAAAERERVPAPAVQRPRGSRALAQRAWLNALASVIVATLVLLSLILMATTLFPSIDVTKVSLVGGALLALGLLAFGLAALRSRRVAGEVTVIGAQDEVPKEQWTMPPLALLARPEWSAGRKVAMLTLRGYLLASVILLIVKAVQLGGG